MPIATSDSIVRIFKNVSFRTLRLSDFDFELPPELIAQSPLPERDGSRLAHVDPETGALTHRQVSDLPELLRPGDLLVTNNSRVFPARLMGKTNSGATVQILLLRSAGGNLWEVLARPARKLPMEGSVVFGEGILKALVVGMSEGGRRTVELSWKGDLYEVLDRIGRTPLPPYIKRGTDDLEAGDRERYQTIYAREKGSIAAPTAGLHITRRLLRSLKDRGIDLAELTLHVGYGTFQPIRTEEVGKHRMELERYWLSAETVRAIERARARGSRVVAVGTTTVRALEAAAEGPGGLRPGSGETDLFVYPGFQFQVVDSLLTNFHLPRSSLLLLVSAFAGTDVVRRAYREAIGERYRFYSYGDCMLLSRSRLVIPLNEGP